MGYADLLTYLGSATGITVSGPLSAALAPADMAVYTVTIDTLTLPLGAFERVIPVRTNDADDATRTITIRGTIVSVP